MLHQKNHYIRINTNQRSQQENLKKSEIQQNQAYKSPQVECKGIYKGNLSKTLSKEDIAKPSGLRTTLYLMGRKNREYVFITVPEHACNELIKLIGVTFQDMCLKIQEARQSNTRCNERRNIAKSTSVRNMNRQQIVYALQTVLSY